ncbi:hypothetical protein [Pseudomonas songnenensis]|jgi:hypothetical protein|uniref:Uncharacterized protein n=1 Tax=Pseudomonas songnenensis TaxID=1176259 RepID=A0A482U2U1_9PSED|nr:hypothetical protein [Pseudomonas songnenensis]MCQ4300439.1 hypothetical protein [Pseudomonas songnenensis]RMH97682.1 hypothetical protein EA798_04435 [Pseudomonas songnenensis]RYJ60976.1 hypothetical protein EJA06_016945 [Pseudomonas songnenensis]
MKLEIARGLFLVGALGVTTLCVAAWNEPGATLVQSSMERSYCPLPPGSKSRFDAARPDQDLLLLLYGLSQGMR